MLFRKPFLEKIKAGKVKVAYRRWEKCAVKIGGLQKTSIGVIRFTKVEEVKQSDLNLRCAKMAGYDSLEELNKDLNFRSTGTIFKISFVLHSDDPRIELRNETKMDNDGLEGIKLRLHRLDQYSKTGPWTIKLLKLIEKMRG